jgi:aminopeptidase
VSQREWADEVGSDNSTPAANPLGLTPVQIDRFAQVMLWALDKARASTPNGTPYRPGDVVILMYNALSEPLAQPVYRRLLERGLCVDDRCGRSAAMDLIAHESGAADQLARVRPWEEALWHHAHGLIALRAPESLTYLSGVDPDQLAAATKPVGAYREIRTAREQRGQFGWTLCELPTPALAAQAQMSLAEYAGQVAQACYLDYDDPVAKWEDTMARVDQVKHWLTSLPIDHVHVQSLDGRTDLKVWLGPDRRWLGGSGHNIPSFEVFVSPAAGRAEGLYYANESSFKSGRYVRGVTLEFRDGRVVRTTAEAEEAFVQSRVALDAGSDKLGEFSLTDRRFSEITRFMASTLYDENVGGEHGNCHVAIGAAYLDSYAGDEAMTPELREKLGFNVSAEHWDLVTTAPRVVTAHLRGGGQLVIYENGQFTCF